MQQESVLTNSYSNSTVFNTCNKQSGVGGLIVGLLTASSVDNLISDVVLEGTVGIGGIVGQVQQNSKLTNSISNATVTGINMVGGIIGDFLENKSITIKYNSLKSESKVDGESNVNQMWGYITDKVNFIEI